MNKKTIRIISTAITILIALILLATTAYAYEPNSVTPNESVNLGNATQMGANILGAIRIIGTIIAVGVIMVLGIKYMMGSSEEKASYKKTMIPYIVGAVLLFAASNLAQVIYDFVK